MDDQQFQARATSFGDIAAAYDAYRPGYPAEAVAWLTGARQATVLELGAGTGKLTSALLDAGHAVIATEPLAGMSAVLRDRIPTARVVASRAEAIPLTSSSVDIVVAGQAFHWFDPEHALPEIARVLKPGGTLGLIWNMGDVKVPWVRRLLALIGLTGDEPVDEPLADSDLFAVEDRRVFRHWQRLDREGLLGYVASNSHIAVMKKGARQSVLTDAGRLYDEYGRGHVGMQLPWITTCTRATVRRLEGAPPPAPVADDALTIDL